VNGILDGSNGFLNFLTAALIFRESEFIKKGDLAYDFHLLCTGNWKSSFNFKINYLEAHRNVLANDLHDEKKHNKLIYPGFSYLDIHRVLETGLSGRKGFYPGKRG
jgi:hypothetical protein